MEHDRYHGRRVVTSGIVGVFDPDTPGEYFVLDDGPHRIGLRGTPALTADVRAYVGRWVRVTGLLTFKPGVGIFLDAEDLREARDEGSRR